jgi:hypothetical protein
MMRALLKKPGFNETAFDRIDQTGIDTPELEEYDDIAGYPWIIVSITRLSLLRTCRDRNSSELNSITISAVNGITEDGDLMSARACSKQVSERCGFSCGHEAKKQL